MPGGNADGGPQVELRDLLALLFAALCGLLLGVAAAPTVLPMLGFAAFAPYVESRAGIHLQRNRTPEVGHAVAATALPSQVSRNRLPSNRALSHRPRSGKQPAPPEVTSPPLAFLFQPNTLFALGLLALAV